MQNRRELGYYLTQLGLIGVGVEVGVFKGEFAEQIMEAWHGRELILVDPWTNLDDYHDSWNGTDAEMEQNYQLTLRRLKPYGDRIHILRMRSEDAAAITEDESCDFVYIDANHSYAAVKRDLHLWFPKLRDGGLMCGHDYFNAKADEDFEPIVESRFTALAKHDLTSYGVKAAVDEFAENRQIMILATEEFEPTWYFVK